jgi:N-carbamoylputrescine amidase
MRGAELILIPTAIGNRCQAGERATSDGYDEAWATVQRGHAVANACFLAAVNRVGFEESPEGGVGTEFWGQSFIADPYGKVVAKAAADREEVLVCPVDLAQIEEIRAGWSFPFRDRRVDSYQGLTRMYLDSEPSMGEP